MRRVLLAVIEYLLGFLALAVFAFLAFGLPNPTDDRLLFAFKAATPVAFAELAFLWWRPAPANRLILGANLWLIAGGLAAWTQQWWWLRGYQQLGEASLFAAIGVAGLVTTALSLQALSQQWGPVVPWSWRRFACCLPLGSHSSSPPTCALASFLYERSQEPAICRRTVLVPNASTTHAASARAIGTLMCAAAMALGLAVLTGCTPSPPALEPVTRGDDAAVQRQLRALLAHELRTGKLASLAVAAVDARGEVFVEAQGFADAAAQTPATPDTLYRMGSVSKLFTVTAALGLVQRGQLRLDSPLTVALPQLTLAAPWPGQPPTIRQLMTHTAGLPRDLLGGMWVDPAAGPVPDYRQLPALLSREVAVLPAGTAVAYSNVGLTLLGLAVEQAAQEPFEAHLQRTLLSPLGMVDASFSAAVPPHARMARGHLKGVPAVEPALRDVPAGGLNASVREVGRFVSMMLAHGRAPNGTQVVEARWVAEMLRPQEAPVLELDARSGLGWFMDAPGGAEGAASVRGGGPALHHDGATFHFRSRVLMLPAQGLGVVVASNDANAMQAVRRVAARVLALQLQARSGIVQAPPTLDFKASDRSFTTAERAACSGDWASPFGVVSVKEEGVSLRAEAMGQRLQIRPGEDGRFGLRALLLGWVPLTVPQLSDIGFECRKVAGRELLVAWRGGQATRAGVRLPAPAQPLPAALSALQGRYALELLPGEVPTLGGVFVQARDGRLWVHGRLHEAFGGQAVPPIPIIPGSNSEARLVGPLGDGGERVTLEPEQDGSVVIRASGWRLRRTGDL